MAAEPAFFETPAQWRAWLAANHASAPELLVGFCKVDSGRASITWPQSVDEALAFGWIDGVRRRICDETYSIRFTPRRPGSIWSQVNLRRFAELDAAGRIAPAGRAAFDARTGEQPTYSFEKPPAELDAAMIARFQANGPAWAAFQGFPPGYRRIVIHWVTSARRPETQLKRLDELIDVSAAGRKIDFMKPTGQR
jgi:uncharacterized protein YdeI (YjbR/CyaY-like superfamily)